MDHFRYINTIRKPDGTLRDWKEHDCLSQYEQCRDNPNLDMVMYPTAAATKIKEDEIYWIRKTK